MGMGEPLQNYEELLRFIKLASDEQGINISQRNITVSTCGLVPQIKKLAEEKLAITLALSLHASTDEEREKMTVLLNSGFIDTFRHFYPDAKDRYSWWSYRFHAREKNVGWRIDYFLVSERLASRLKSAEIHDNIMGSDHCPVSITLI